MGLLIIKISYALQPSLTYGCAHLRSVFFNKNVSDIRYLQKNPTYLYNDKPHNIT